MTTATRDAHPRRWVLALLAAVLAVAAGPLGAAPASAATGPAAQTRVGASHLAAAVDVGPSAGVVAGQRIGKDLAQPGIVVATGVAAETAGEAPYLYRGLAADHPALEDAINGVARPRGGHANPALHNGA